MVHPRFSFSNVLQWDGTLSQYALQDSIRKVVGVQYFVELEHSFTFDEIGGYHCRRFGGYDLPPLVVDPILRQIRVAHFDLPNTTDLAHRINFYTLYRALQFRMFDHSKGLVAIKNYDSDADVFQALIIHSAEKQSHT